jgi:hypothetical protein
MTIVCVTKAIFKRSQTNNICPSFRPASSMWSKEIRYGLCISIVTISGVSVTETNWEGTFSQKPEAEACVLHFRVLCTYSSQNLTFISCGWSVRIHLQTVSWTAARNNVVQLFSNCGSREALVWRGRRLLSLARWQNCKKATLSCRLSLRPNCVAYIHQQGLTNIYSYITTIVTTHQCILIDYFNNCKL